MSTLWLPWPPSINHLWIPTGNPRQALVLAPEARRYRDEVAVLVHQARWGPIGRHALLQVQCDVFPPDRRRRDIDNPLKCVLDALAAALVFDDSQVRELVVRQHAPTATSGWRVTLWVWQLRCRRQVKRQAGSKQKQEREYP